ncbi:MAG: lipopolysaccharide kinase InaA family protein [Pseudomonadota bacterium]
MSGKRISVKQTLGGIAYNPDFEKILCRNSLLDFNKALHLDEGEVIKHAIPERKTVKINLKDIRGFFGAYLKCQYPVSFWKFFGRLLKLSIPRTAYDEFENIIAFHQAGIPTVIPLAAGVRKCGIVQSTSFLITQALEGCTRLDHFFSSPHPASIEIKRALITKAALLVKKMHACGFNHRDLYLCHILLHTTGELYIVDLHRAGKRARVPVRWKIKDIAALNYSAPRHSISLPDRLRFLKTYLGTDHLSGRERHFALKVLKKTKKMIKHNRNCAVGTA